MADAKTKPAVFTWRGPVPQHTLDEWLHARDLRIPADLATLLITTGGGELFESETILSPDAAEESESLDYINDHHRARGLPPGYLVFGDGAWLSAVRLRGLAYVILEREHYREIEEFPTLDAWYRLTLRAEYADRYGLA